MATTAYKVKSSAVRAAKREFGEHWAETMEVVEVAGEFFIQFKDSRIEQAQEDDARAEAGQSTAALLAEHEAEEKAKAQKAKALKAQRPKHTPKDKPGQAVDLEASHDDDEPTRIPFGGEAEPSDKELAEAQRQADAQANAAAVNVNPLRPRLSTAEKPTKLVWAIADELTSKDPDITRAQVIEECVRRGIAYGTSRTQYQHWFKTKQDAAKTPRASIKDGKIIPAKA